MSKPSAILYWEGALAFTGSLKRSAGAPEDFPLLAGWMMVPVGETLSILRRGCFLSVIRPTHTFYFCNSVWNEITRPISENESNHAFYFLSAEICGSSLRGSMLGLCVFAMMKGLISGFALITIYSIINACKCDHTSSFASWCHLGNACTLQLAASLCSLLQSLSEERITQTLLDCWSQTAF